MNDVKIIGQYKMKKSVVFAGLLASSVLASPYLMAETQTKPDASQQVVQAVSQAPSKTDKEAINAQIKKQQALLKETNKDIGKVCRAWLRL